MWVESSSWYSKVITVYMLTCVLHVTSFASPTWSRANDSLWTSCKSYIVHHNHTSYSVSIMDIMATLWLVPIVSPRPSPNCHPSPVFQACTMTHSWLSHCWMTAPTASAPCFARCWSNSGSFCQRQERKVWSIRCAFTHLTTRSLGTLQFTYQESYSGEKKFAARRTSMKERKQWRRRPTTTRIRASWLFQHKAVKSSIHNVEYERKNFCTEKNFFLEINLEVEARRGSTSATKRYVQPFHFWYTFRYIRLWFGVCTVCTLNQQNRCLQPSPLCTVPGIRHALPSTYCTLHTDDVHSSVLLIL